MLISENALSKKPSFIVFEGLNGAGKSTLIKGVADNLLASRSVITTFEPGATTLGIKIREILLGQNDPSNSLNSTTELLLFAADRAEHVAKVIRPALKSSKTVLCDRYIYSTMAFQGFGRGIEMATIDSVCEIATQKVVPDLVILLDLDVHTALSRTVGRGQGGDSFESETLAFHERLRQGFLHLAQHRPEPFLVLPATHTPEKPH